MEEFSYQAFYILVDKVKEVLCFPFERLERSIRVT